MVRVPWCVSHAPSPPWCVSHHSRQLKGLGIKNVAGITMRHPHGQFFSPYICFLFLKAIGIDCDLVLMAYFFDALSKISQQHYNYHLSLSKSLNFILFFLSSLLP